jgi:tetratricopeptide (TPR) repeat protein
VDEQLFKELERINSMIGVLHRSSEANPQSDVEATLIQYAQEVIAKGTAMHQSSHGPNSHSGVKEVVKDRSFVAEWICSLQSLQQEASIKQDNTADAISVHLGRRERGDQKSSDSDDDLETDIARASLETGVEAFEMRKWDEADSLLHEALRGLQHLSIPQRRFCDIFDLHYRLSACAYHTQPSGDAEMALLSFIRQPANSDKNRVRIYDATHLLSQLYIRMGKYESAQSECEKTLQARRRLLGKFDDASLESMALMAHIYVSLDNRARAKSCLSMIPEKQRDTILAKVEESLGAEIKHIDFSSLLARPAFEEAGLRLERRNSGSTLGMAKEDQSFRCFSLMGKTPAPSIRQAYRQSMLHTTAKQQLSPVASSPSSWKNMPGWRQRERSNEFARTERAASDVTSVPPSESTEAETTSKTKHLSRQEILARIGCQPKEPIEEIVCNGDHPALVNFLGKKKEIWRSKFRKHVRPERLTALHYAALFGEIDMARRLLNSGFNINDTPYGYTTSLSPLKMAIGARQVSMVEFLIGQNARPAEPETWATLAGQLLSRSWIEKTLSEADRDVTANRIVSIMNILLKRGWTINAPCEASGSTVLHQAVSFWSGSYVWDLHLRVAVTTFLCQHGANPFQGNKDAKTPYDLALASGHRDILMILDQNSKRGAAAHVVASPVELSG